MTPIGRNHTPDRPPLAAYRRIKKEQPENVSVSEQRLNTLGYDLLRAKKTRESIAVFALNAELYPQSSNVHDSLGEAYAENGEKELAIKSYRRSLELNPQNTNAVEIVKKLEGEKKQAHAASATTAYGLLIP